MKKHLEKNIKETQQFLEDKIFKLYIANTPLCTKGNFSVDKKITRLSGKKTMIIFYPYLRSAKELKKKK